MFKTQHEDLNTIEVHLYSTTILALSRAGLALNIVDASTLTYRSITAPPPHIPYQRELQAPLDTVSPLSSY